MGEGDISGKHELSVRQTKELFDYRKVCQFDQNDRSEVNAHKSRIYAFSLLQSFIAKPKKRTQLKILHLITAFEK